MQKPMRIAGIAHALRAAGGLSVGQNLVASLARVGAEHEFLFTVPADANYEAICSRHPNTRAIVYRHTGGLLRRWMYDTRELPAQIAAFNPDVIVALGNRGLLQPPCPQAVLCHDPHLFYPRKYYGNESLRVKAITWYHCRYFGRQLHRTELLLTQTATAAARLKSTYNYTGRTAICPNAVSKFTLSGDAEVEEPRSIGAAQGKFRLFYLTRYYAHKNLESLVELFRRYPRELSDVVAFVTVAAEQHPNAPRFLRLIEKHGLGDRIVNVGPLPQESLAGFFRHCHALFMPTLLESFSGTYLEAMHFGLPILTSDLDFAHEVCGDAALFFDPWNPGSMCDAILRLKADAGLGRELTTRGRERLGSFFGTWDDVAAKLLAELEQLVRKEPCVESAAT